MGLIQDIRTVTELKTGAARLLEQLNSGKRPIIITQEGKPRAVMMDVQSYEEMQDAFGLLKLAAMGEEEVRQGKVVRQEVLFKRLERKYGLGKKDARRKA